MVWNVNDIFLSGNNSKKKPYRRHIFGKIDIAVIPVIQK